MRAARAIGVGGLFAVAMAAVAAALVAPYARTSLAERHPAPGRLVSVGGHRLHLNCEGDRRPTVVLEAGLGDFSIHWRAVQAALRDAARTCAYDRAGLGWSEAASSPPTLGEAVGDLHRLLAAAGEGGPYVVVGHSYGGVMARAFASRFPGEVAALVLVDSAHEAQLDRIPGLARALESAAGGLDAPAWFARHGFLAFAPGSLPVRGLAGADAEDYRAVLATTGTLSTLASEMRSLRARLEAARAMPATRAVPAVVLRRGRPEPMPGAGDEENRALEKTWEDLQSELAARFGTQAQAVAGAGHDIPIQQPLRVAEAVRSVLPPPGGR